MSPPTSIAACLLLATALLLAGCKGTGKKAPAGPPTFEAVLVIGATELLATEIVEQLDQRIAKLDFHAAVESADPGEPGRIKVALYAATEAEARKQAEALCHSGSLGFRKVHPRTRELADEVVAGNQVVPGYTPVEHKWTDDDGHVQTENLLLAKGSSLSAADVKNAYPDPARAGLINVELTAKGGEKMRRLTEPMNKGVDRLAIILNGEVKSAPVVQDTLSTAFVITGIEGDEERERLCQILLVPLGAELSVESLTALPAPAP